MPGFDSQYYLNTYPEVINLIGNGIYTSAIDHYLKSGQALGNYSFAPGSVVWGTSRADIVVLREGNETAKLGNGNDRVEGRAGNDTLDGGDGVDEALYDGPSQVYSIAKQSGNTWHVTDQRASIQVVGGPQSDGIDQLANIERLKFLDKSLAIDLDGNSGNAARILATVFGKDAIKNPTYAGIAISLFDQGLSKDQVSQVALNAVYGANPKSKDIISMIWKNLTGSAIDDKSLADLSGLIDSKAITAAQLATKAADLDLTAQVIDLVGLSKAGWEYVPFGG